jgi:hypothetical protein
LRASGGILYCDLRPSNVLVDEFGVMKLSDFRHVRRIPQRLDELLVDSVAGLEAQWPVAPAYAAPELFASLPSPQHNGSGVSNGSGTNGWHVV